ncbi:TetR/AcrR family transcriptional regulator [Kibdelosporangium lantanae]
MSSLGRIQRAAVRLFADHGFAATGIRDISRSAGLNSAMIYHHTGGKEQLLAVIMRATLANLLTVGAQAVATTDEPVVRLVRLVRTHVTMAAVNPLSVKVTNREVHALTGDNHAEIMDLRDRYETLFRDALRHGIAAGELHPADPVIARLALIEMCNGVANWYRADGRLAVPELVDRFADLACRVVASRSVTRAETNPDVPVPHLDSEPR